jgi:hypothetical protein
VDLLRFIHISHIASIPPALNAKAVAKEVAKIFPSCKIDIRPPFEYDEKIIEQARIADVKQPFEKQPKQKQDGIMIPLYDGFVMQKILAEMIPFEEINLTHIHILFTSLLTCTFSEDDDWRYHARAIICGTPSIISTTGIVEALAKPREFYLSQLGNVVTSDIGSLKKKFAGRFISYDDNRITAASVNYALQAIFFFISGGEPFCNNKYCKLYNAHWQEDLVYTIEKGILCSHHKNLVNKFLKESYSA